MVVMNAKKLDGIKIARVSTVVFFIDTQLHVQITKTVEAGASVTIVASEQEMDRTISDSCYVSLDIPRKIHLLRDVVALFKLWYFFRKSKFDIIHSTTPKAGLLCALAGFLARVPIRIHTFTGQPWVGLTGMKRWVSKTSDKIILLLNTRCYTDSFSQRNFLVESGIAQVDKVGVLGSGSLAGVDLQRFNASRFNSEDKYDLKMLLGIPNESKVLLFVGRVTKDKGVAELLAAFSHLVTQGINSYLILLGPFEDDASMLLDTVVTKVKEKIITPGFTHEPERFMALADVLILPSYREGFGTVIIEAAAMRVPSIGTKIYGLSDAIVDGLTGVLVPIKNIDRLSLAMKELLENDSLRIKLGENALNRVVNEFSDTTMSDLVIDEYVSLLNKYK